MADYVAEFEKLGFGMFVHYGLHPRAAGHERKN